MDIHVHRLLMLNEVTQIPTPQTCFMLPPNTTTALCLVSPFGTALTRICNENRSSIKVSKKLHVLITTRFQHTANIVVRSLSVLHWKSEAAGDLGT